jgi:hypothetical protein
MAHFAEIRDGIVARVVVVPREQEERGQEFLAVDLGMGGTWVQTSYTGSIRRRFAGVGMSYDPTRDSFIEQQPHQSWALDADGDWQPPIPMPIDGDWDWDEVAGAWVEVLPPAADD